MRMAWAWTWIWGLEGRRDVASAVAAASDAVQRVANARRFSAAVALVVRVWCRDDDCIVMRGNVMSRHIKTSSRRASSRLVSSSAPSAHTHTASEPACTPPSLRLAPPGLAQLSSAPARPHPSRCSTSASNQRATTVGSACVRPPPRRRPLLPALPPAPASPSSPSGATIAAYCASMSLVAWCVSVLSARVAGTCTCTCPAAA